MYSEIDTSKLTSAGRYLLDDVVLVSYQSADGSNKNAKSVSIRSLVQEINIYESLEGPGLSGNVVLQDGKSIVSHLPLTGYERIEFKLYTPGCSRGYDFSSITGHPMYVYKISGRMPTTPRSQLYMLHFCSKEMIDNEMTRVNRTLTGSVDQMVIDIFRNDLNSTKNMIVENSKGIHKIIIPRLKPFKAISMLATKTEPMKYNSSGMLLYEDSTGFRFRSLENMLAIAGVARPVTAKFQMKPRNVKGGTGVTDVIKEMQTVDGYTILDQYDTLKNLANGVYASKMVTHDIFNKNFSETAFDYNINFDRVHHTEHDGRGGLTDNKSQLPILNYKNGKMISDHAEGTVNFVSTTKKVQNDYELPETDRMLPQSMSQKLAFRSQQLSLDCKGFTGISVGDLCSFEVPSYEPVSRDKPLDIDPYMSGRYLVRKIHHRIISATDKHTMNLQIVKDAVRVAYPEENIDTFTDRANNEAITYLQYQIDDSLTETADTETKEVMA
tara:strand:- start:223 stop:1713 length:1491 start_codon:yes stop_codon:yes gene_type:complete